MNLLIQFLIPLSPWPVKCINTIWWIFWMHRIHFTFADILIIDVVDLSTLYKFIHVPIAVLWVMTPFSCLKLNPEDKRQYVPQKHCLTFLTLRGIETQTFKWSDRNSKYFFWGSCNILLNADKCRKSQRQLICWIWVCEGSNRLMLSFILSCTELSMIWLCSVWDCLHV